MHSTNIYGQVFSIVIIGVFASSITSGQENAADNRFSAEAFGFQISRPDDDWKIGRIEPKPGSVMVKVSRKDAGGKIEATVIAEPISKSSENATEKRDSALDRIKGKKEFFNRGKKTFEVAGKSAPGFEVDWKVQGEVYRVHQCYVANQEFMYTIAIHGPAEQFDSLAETLIGIRDTIKFVPISEKAKRASKLRNLVGRCGSEVKWAKTWDEASELAKRENKTVLVHIKAQTGFDISDAFTTNTLMDPDIIEFVNERCVVFRYTKGMKAPFNAYEKYGIGPSSFGSTILLVEPDGTVFGDTFSPESHTFYDFLLTSFADRSTADEASLELDKPFQTAQWYSRRGQLAAALKQLDVVETVEAHRLRASIFARQRKLDVAIAELDQANKKANDPELQAVISLDKTILGASGGKIAAKDAQSRFSEFLEKHPQHDRAAEAMYWIGLCQFVNSNKDKAEITWMKLIESFDNSNRWTWQAAASLSSTSFKMNIVPDLGWPKEDVIEAFRSIPFETIDVAQIDTAKKEAIGYLLDNQREDGSWISPPNALKEKGYNTSPFTIAITSICAKSFLPHHDDPEIASRIERAVAFLVDSHQEPKSDANKAVYMDYSPWSDAYLLRFLAHYINVQPEDVQQKKRKLVAPLVRDAIKSLSEKQKPGGGWSYYITHNLANANQPSNQSISFMTATVTIALLETRAAGFEVSEELTDSAVDCLESMRCQDKTFTYFLWHERESQGQSSGEEGSAGRGPLCSLALSMAGRSRKQEINNCLDLFLKYRTLYSRERGKSLMHAAPGGQGSHYLMFDYNWAAAAVASLPDDQKEKYRDRLLELILTSRSNQGSYLDNPINGWHYGTGMALEAMTLLQ